jgi:hypothetical protein
MAERRVMSNKASSLAKPAIVTNAQKTGKPSPFGPRRQITLPIGARGIGATRPADATATRTVTVACKIPNGILLRTFHPEMEKEQTPNGVRDIQVFRPDPEVFHVKGPALPFGKTPIGFTLEGGYALTRGIPEDFWTKWVEQNADLDALKNGLIFACRTQQEAAQEAHSMRKVKSGLEPLDPDNLPPEFKRIKTHKPNDDAEMTS